MGLFVYTQKGSIISMVDLPTTEIIEPILVTQKTSNGVFLALCQIVWEIAKLYKQALRCLFF